MKNTLTINVTEKELEDKVKEVTDNLMKELDMTDARDRSLIRLAMSKGIGIATDLLVEKLKEQQE